ncbi:hypothetical protein M8J76_013436 [Diaphorina citri]|nr:hypothetical protein M8J75_001243 [Diaphorina citri]KAI5733572.1 hypothetical protein M8J76_013436 [Diaphorina citri]
MSLWCQHLLKNPAKAKNHVWSLVQFKDVVRLLCCQLCSQPDGNVRHSNHCYFTIGQHKFELTKEQKSQLDRLVHLPIIHTNKYECTLPPNHRFPMSKFSKTFNYLVRDKVIDKSKQLIEPQQISESIAELVHTKEYVHKFFNGKTTEKEQKVTGFEWSAGLASRVRYETGGTILTALIAVQRGLASSTAGGTHHAFPDHGAGFCLMNDMALAARYLIRHGIVRKVLIVDLDVHQGDGTAFIFDKDPAVFTFSMHCGRNYPFRKQCSDLDVAIDVGYQATLKEHLPGILAQFKPDLVIYDAGVDPHQHDELGKLNLTDHGLYMRDYYVLDTAISAGIPVATVTGGGYCADIDQLAQRQTIIHRAATHVYKERGL